MGWRWVPDHEPAGWTDQTFPTQGEAESWLGEFFPDLVGAGVGEVSLYEADRRVYGPMTLDADAS